jgi:chloride channel, nucleotide-sensitive, 1A
VYVLPYASCHPSLTRLLSVEPIFEALSLCASLHPDPADEDDMDDDDDLFVDADENSPFETFNGTDGEELSEVGRVRSNFINDSRYAPY